MLSELGGMIVIDPVFAESDLKSNLLSYKQAFVEE